MSIKFRDYYATLGVSRNASQDEIKKAFRDKARECHPDLAKVENRASAEERFKEINEAYEVLKNPESRKKYDRLGADWDKYGESEYRQSRTYGRPEGRSRSNRAGYEYHFGGMGFSDFFERFFGGTGADPFASFTRGGASEGRTYSRSVRGSDVEAEILVTLEEANKGASRRISLQKTNPVTGEEKTEMIDVRIPAGIRDGQRIRLAGQGQPSREGDRPGDLYLKARFAQHPYYVVTGDDLRYELKLAPWEAALGETVVVPTLSGSAKLKIPEKTQNGRQFRMRGYGLTNSRGGRGDLLVEARIVLPQTMNKREKELWMELKRVSRFHPRDR